MSDISNFVNAVDGFDINAILKEVWTDFRVESYIIKLNTIEQLYEKGERADGVSLGDYTPFTIQMKLNGNGDRRIDHVTLKDSGDFYESFEVSSLSNGFEITANTIKDNDDLSQKYGKAIIGLSNESIEKLAEFIRPIFVEKATQKLYAKR